MPDDHLHSEALATARALLERGYRVHPLCPLTPHRHGDDECHSLGKVPLRKAWQLDPEHRETISVGPDGGIGIVCGDGLLVLDEDEIGALASLFEAAGEAPPPPTVFSGKGGQHVWLRVPDGVRTPRNTQGGKKRSLAVGVDTRGDGGQVVVPPSPHVSGTVYEWADGLPPPIAELPLAPAWLLQRIAKRPAPMAGQTVAPAYEDGEFRDRGARSLFEGALKRITDGSGSRHDGMLHAACVAHGLARAGRANLGVMRTAVGAAFAVAKPDAVGEFEGAWAWASDHAEPIEARTITARAVARGTTFTEEAQRTREAKAEAERVEVERIEGEVVGVDDADIGVKEDVARELADAGYVHLGDRYGGWHRWDEHGWQPMPPLLLRAVVRGMLEAREEEAPTQHMVSEIIAHAGETRCFPREAMEARAADPEWAGAFLLSDGERIDGALFRDAVVFGDGSVRAMGRDVFAPFGVLPYEWGDGAEVEPSRTRALLEGTQMEGVPWDFQCRYVGAAIFANGEHQTMLNLFGVGGSGKGTTSRLWAALLGGGRRVLSFASTEVLGNRFALARLPHSRMVLFPDLPSDYADHAEGLHVLKALIGGDAVRGEVKRGDSFEMVFGGLVIGLSNFQPRFTRGLADAQAWRRRMLPIRYEHVPAEVVPGLENQIIEEEGEALARWCVQAYIDAEWDALPAAIVQLREEVEMASASSAAEYVLERYVGNRIGIVYHDSVMADLKVYNEGKSRRDEISQRAVSRVLNEMGAVKRRKGGRGARRYQWEGLARLTDSDEEHEADEWMDEQGAIAIDDESAPA